MDDLVAVMDAAGSEKATLVAHGQPNTDGVMAAATHPGASDIARPHQRLRSVRTGRRLSRGHACERSEDIPRQHRDAVGQGNLSSFLGPSVGSDRSRRVVGACRALRRKPAPALGRGADDVRSTSVNVLPLVDVPTLVVHSRNNEYVRVGHGRYLAEHMPAPRLLERDSADHWPLPSQTSWGDRAVRHGTRAGSRTRIACLRPSLFMDVVELD